MAIYDITGNPLNSIDKSIFVNVRDFGAVGDGVTDDTAAIQTALDSLKDSGGTIFFPHGVYVITNPIYFYSNQILDFDYSTILQGATIDNLIMSYCERAWGGYDGTHDAVLKNAIFDGGAYEVNNTLLGIVHAKNIKIENCSFVNAYGTWHNIEINSSLNCKVLNCRFDGSRKTGANGCMIQIDAYTTDGTWPWANGAVDGTLASQIEIAGCRFYNGETVPGIGNHSETQSENIRVHDCIFDGCSGTRGAIRISAKNVDIYNNTFIGCSVVAVSIRKYAANVSTTLESTVRDNRFINCMGAISEGATAYNNMNGSTLTE